MPVIIQEVVGKFEAVKRDGLFHPLGPACWWIWVKMHSTWDCNISTSRHDPRRAMEGVSAKQQEIIPVSIQIFSCRGLVAACVWWTIQVFELSNYRREIAGKYIWSWHYTDTEIQWSKFISEYCQQVKFKIIILGAGRIDQTFCQKSFRWGQE